MLSSQISSNEFKSFLNCGAVLRWNETYYLSVGPFSADSRDQFKIYSPDFFMDFDLALKSGVTSFQLTETQFLKELENYASANSPIEWSDPLIEDYRTAFEKIKAEMANGVLDKAVPVLFAKANCDFDISRRAEALRRLTMSPARLFVYGIWHAENGMIGATPETLITFFSGEIRSMALAGTQMRGVGDCSLMSDTKELHEHAITSRAIQETLSAYGEVICEGPHILELPSLWHLKTEMRVKSEASVDMRDLIKKMHPTPALGVSPRTFDYQWMRGLPEAEIREKYGAPFAVQFPNGDFVSIVAIRNIQWNQNQILLGSGGGVVKESQLEKEWLELEGKRNSVRSLMAL